MLSTNSIETKKERIFLKTGLFELPFMNSRVKTNAMTTKEKVLGYLVGPMGMAIFIAMYNTLFELYFTQVFVMDAIYGTGTYQIMRMTGAGVGILMGILLGWLIDRTMSSQGKIRPYVLIGSVLAVFTGTMVFIIPFQNYTANLVYIFVLHIIFHGFALVAYLLRVTMLMLATRNQKDRTQIVTFDRATNFLIAGVLIGLMVGSFLYFVFLIDPIRQSNWQLFMFIAFAIALPLIFVEYFNTKERITFEERNKRKTADKSIAPISLKEQLKGLLTNKYWLMAFFMILTTSSVNHLRGVNVQINFFQHILGADAQNNLALLYNLTAGIPMGIGIIVIYALARKYTVRKVTLISFMILIIGSGIALIDPRNPVLAIICGFIINAGNVANVYVFGVITASAGDAVENKSGFRPEGCLAAMIAGALSGVLFLPLAGLYETLLIASGYDATVVQQLPATENLIIFMMYIVPMIALGITAIILYFYDIEKKLPQMQKENLEAQKAAVIARGDVWIDPQEAERLEREENERLSEEARIADLKNYCEKKGLNFETENEKYLNKIAEKERKKADRVARKETKRHVKS